MKHHTALIVACIAALPLSTAALAAPSLLPMPATVEVTGGTCEIGPDVSFSCEPTLRPQVEFHAGLLRAATGWPVPVKEEAGTVQFTTVPTLPEEGYTLRVGKDGIEIRASGRSGFFYAFQTLRQLMPPEAVRRDGKVAGSWKIPCVAIKDQPRFAWRGILVDVSRHFQTKEAMMELIDAMALSKLNTLHWHLTDDPGWRIEIEAYPKLARDSKQFYTQDEIREVVKYATQRGVRIVPEIDVPGHSSAAVRSYPFLGCKLKDGRIGRVYNPAKETTYEFLDKVIGEVAALFPAAYIHLGADEVGKGAWKQDPDCKALMKKQGIKTLHDLQTHFVRRTAEIIKKHGKKPMAWDEALGDGLGGDLTIMSWRGMQPGLQALEMGREVVFTPVSSLYFDRANSRSAANPKGYSANTVNLHRVYHFQATPPWLTDAQKKLVLGAQGSIWGEKITGKDHMLRQAMLRGCALGEALWSPQDARNWEDFLARLAPQRKRLDAMGIPYFWEPETTAVTVGTWKVAEIGRKQNTLKWDVSAHITKPGLYEFTFEYLNGPGTFQIQNAALLENGTPVAEDTHSSTATIDPRRPNQYYLLMVKNHRPDAKYELSATLSPAKGGAGGAAMLVPPPAKYSSDGAPGKKANRSNQKQPDEL